MQLCDRCARTVEVGSGALPPLQQLRNEIQQRAERQRAACTRRRSFYDAHIPSLLKRTLSSKSILLFNERRRSCACGRSTSGTASWRVRSCGICVLSRTRQCASSAATSSRATRSRVFRVLRPGTSTCVPANTRLPVHSTWKRSQCPKLMKSY